MSGKNIIDLKETRERSPAYIAFQARVNQSARIVNTFPDNIVRIHPVQLRADALDGHIEERNRKKESVLDGDTNASKSKTRVKARKTFLNNVGKLTRVSHVLD